MIEKRGATSPPLGNLSPDELALWTGFAQTHAVLARELDTDLRVGHGVSLSDYEILSGLGALPCERVRMAALADRVELSPSGLSRAIERLEARGLVRREPCSEDRRGAFAALTDAGLALVLAAGATHAAGIRRRFLDRITPEERRSMASAWARLLAGSKGYCGWRTSPDLPADEAGSETDAP